MEHRSQNLSRNLYSSESTSLHSIGFYLNTCNGHPFGLFLSYWGPVPFTGHFPPFRGVIFTHGTRIPPLHLNSYPPLSCSCFQRWL